VSLTACPTLQVAGRIAPASSPDSLLSTTLASGRPWQLDDRDWLARRYLEAGDNAIATELGVSPGTVIRARKRLRIASLPPGRRRGARPAPPRPSAAELIAERIAEESRRRGPAPTLTLVAGRVRALHDANAAGDHPARLDALVALGSACGLVLNHLQRAAAA
jgi:hypothetical protein